MQKYATEKLAITHHKTWAGQSRNSHRRPITRRCDEGVPSLPTFSAGVCEGVRHLELGGKGFTPGKVLKMHEYFFYDVMVSLLRKMFFVVCLFVCLLTSETSFFL